MVDIDAFNKRQISITCIKNDASRKRDNRKKYALLING